MLKAERGQSAAPYTLRAHLYANIWSFDPWVDVFGDLCNQCTFILHVSSPFPGLRIQTAIDSFRWGSNVLGCHGQAIKTENSQKIVATFLRVQNKKQSKGVSCLMFRRMHACRMTRRHQQRAGPRARVERKNQPLLCTKICEFARPNHHRAIM